MSHCVGNVNPVWIISLPLLPIQCGFKKNNLNCQGAVLLVFRSFLERVALNIVVVLVYLWKEMSSGSSYSIILIPPYSRFSFVDQGNLDFSTMPDILLFIFVDRQSCMLCCTKCQTEIESYKFKKQTII